MSSFSVGSIYFAEVGQHTPEFVVLTILVRLAQVWDTEDVMLKVDSYCRLGFGVIWLWDECF